VTFIANAARYARCPSRSPTSPGGERGLSGAEPASVTTPCTRAEDGSFAEHHPVNGYVARALGEVNLLTGPARRYGPNDYALSVDGQTIRFNGGVDLVEGSEHTIGVRPEQLIITRTVPDGPAAQAVVDYVSFAGSLSRVGLQLGSGRLVAECPGVLDDLRPGDDAWVSWRPEAWQLLRD
jgi:TOBE domain